MEVRGRILQTTKKKKKKKKKRSLQQPRNLFPLLLAACCCKSNDRMLIKKFLNKVFLSLPRLDLSPFLSLLPPLLKFNCAEVVCKSLEIIGAAALASFDMNEKVVMEDEIVKGLISLSGNPQREIAMAACNAVLDLSTASVGSFRLREFSATERFFLYFIQDFNTLPTVPFSEDVKLIAEDDYRILLLHCAITLANACTIEQLQQIPNELSQKFTTVLKFLWGTVHKQWLCSTSSHSNPMNKFCIGNISFNSLAESIFRLSLNYTQHPAPIDFENVKKTIFGLEEVSIKQFLLETWETSPMLIRNMSADSMGQDAIFSPFIHYLGPKEEIRTFIPSMLKGTISCPAIVSDDLNILHVINEIRNHLGYPLIYNQDIRAVKTQSEGTELHYFQNPLDSSCTLAPHVLSIDDIMKCEEAFKQGYSIALRGMEFRFQSIAAVADGLASLFGQPSAGVNMYLTPPNSQGLARHSDDHCVFVCQLFGVKRWAVFSRSNSQLPRLYESVDNLQDLEEESHTGGCQHFLLKEGDILYIPRGSPHEARTDASADYGNANDTNGFSLHLTLAIEIEPPFEWEGFMQVALYCWDKKESVSQDEPCGCGSMLWNGHATAVRLLHVAIKLISNVDPRFRKACLVGATALSSLNTNTFDSQCEFFKYLVCRIASESKFSEALEHLIAAIQRSEDPLEHIRWMKCLVGMDELQSSGISTPDHSYSCLLQHSDIAEAAFVQVKSKFCSEVKFQDVVQHHKVVLDKYRKVRKQYTNGMLSLHSALRRESEITAFDDKA